MKEFPNGSKKKWTRIFKKKWFFPAMYIVLAAFLLSGVVWYQNVQSKMFEGIDDLEGSDHQQDDLQSDRYDEEAESVVSQEETVKMPVEEETQTEIVTTFYDYTADEDEQEKGLTFYNNRYYQSTGVDIAAGDGEEFDVMASLSGTVEEVKQDPLHGNVIVVDHGDDITTYYASMEDVKVEEEDKVKQGDQLGVAGNNLFGEDSGTHVHFEISKEDTALNPEDFFNQSLETLKETNVEYDTESNMMEDPKENDEDVDQEEDLDEDAEQEGNQERDMDDGIDKEDLEKEIEEDSKSNDDENEEASTAFSFSIPV